MTQAGRRVLHAAYRGLCTVVMALAWVSAAGVLFIILLTVVDVLSRRLLGRPVQGSMDLVQIAAAVSTACALPYTTAVKGHVAVEFLFQRLGRIGRVIVDTLARLLLMAFFSVLALALFRRGQTLQRAREVTLTLQIPTFWVLYVFALCCAVVVLIKIYHLFHPGREMIKP
jgi:TRAP-type C4-dicarboxylate transport system permease small subunit